MAHPGHRPIDGAPIRLPAGPSKVIGTYESYASTRKLGLGIMVGGFVAGLAFVLHGALAYTHQECDGGSCQDVHDLDKTEFGIGAALMLGGLVIGTPFLAAGDEVHLRVIPGVAPVSPSLASPERSSGTTAPRGLTLSAAW
jgi:hypothetical protein